VAAACLRAELFIECPALALGSEPLQSPFGAYLYLYRHTSGNREDKGADGNLGIRRFIGAFSQLSDYAGNWHNWHWLCLAWCSDHSGCLHPCPQAFCIGGNSLCHCEPLSDCHCALFYCHCERREAISRRPNSKY